MVTNTKPQKYTHVPFGSKTKRFGAIRFHPDLDPSGFYQTKPKGCDPCLYSPNKVQCHLRNIKKNHKDPWRYQTELEDWAQNLGYRNQKVLEQRKWYKSILGPAWHEMHSPENILSVCKNIGFGRTPRTAPLKSNYPGPGTYYKVKPYKAPYGAHSTRPTFEREGMCRFKDTSPKWSLAANRYSVIDRHSIEQKSNKLVSVRGPYDLFTGKRDGSTINNHFSTSQKSVASTWPLTLKGCLEKYKNSHFGEMNKTNRDKPYRGRNALVDSSMCPRQPHDPGPGHYNMDKAKPCQQNTHGFNSSFDKPPGYQRVVVWPGVGRYRVPVSSKIAGHGHRHVFQSKLQRTIGANIPQPMNSF